MSTCACDNITIEDSLKCMKGLYSTTYINHDGLIERHKKFIHNVSGDISSFEASHKFYNQMIGFCLRTKSESSMTHDIILLHRTTRYSAYIMCLPHDLPLHLRYMLILENIEPHDLHGLCVY